MNKWNRTQLLPDRPGIPPMARMPEPETIDFDALAGALGSGDYDCICVLGPTASGKTRYAVWLAGILGGEILSADSRQVYRGMDIGTGKDLKEYGDVPAIARFEAIFGKKILPLLGIRLIEPDKVILKPELVGLKP